MAEIDFQTFMIEIGQWKIKDGQTIQCGSYMPKETIMSKYKDWVKRKTKK